MLPDFYIPRLMKVGYKNNLSGILYNKKIGAHHCSRIYTTCIPYTCCIDSRTGTRPNFFFNLCPSPIPFTSLAQTALKNGV